MGLIKNIIERREKKKNNNQNCEIKEFLNSELPCSHIIELSSLYGDEIWVLLEYSPSVIAMLLNTNIDFDCRIKILSGKFIGNVYTVNRFNNKNPTLSFSLSKEGILKISALGYTNNNVFTWASSKSFMKFKFGDTIKIKKLIKCIKFYTSETSNSKLISKNFKSKEMARRLYDSEDIFLAEKCNRLNK